MVTDTAPLRYPYCRLAEDGPRKIQVEHPARVVVGLAEVIRTMANR
jgi:hypothetical protein